MILEVFLYYIGTPFEKTTGACYHNFKPTGDDEKIYYDI